MAYRRRWPLRWTTTGVADGRVMIGLIGGTVAMVQVVTAHTTVMGKTLYVLQFYRMV
jgi:hypothetical protein